MSKTNFVTEAARKLALFSLAAGLTTGAASAQTFSTKAPEAASRVKYSNMTLMSDEKNEIPIDASVVPNFNNIIVPERTEKKPNSHILVIQGYHEQGTASDSAYKQLLETRRQNIVTLKKDFPRIPMTVLGSPDKGTSSTSFAQSCSEIRQKTALGEGTPDYLVILLADRSPKDGIAMSAQDPNLLPAKFAAALTKNLPGNLNIVLSPSGAGDMLPAMSPHLPEGSILYAFSGHGGVTHSKLELPSVEENGPTNPRNIEHSSDAFMKLAAYANNGYTSEVMAVTQGKEAPVILTPDAALLYMAQSTEPVEDKYITFAQATQYVFTPATQRDLANTLFSMALNGDIQTRDRANIYMSGQLGMVSNAAILFAATSLQKKYNPSMANKFGLNSTDINFWSRDEEEKPAPLKVTMPKTGPKTGAPQSP